MLNITIVTNSGKKNVIADSNITPAELLEQNGINTGSSTVSINSRPLSYADYDRSFADLGCSGSVVLAAIVKADSAND